MKTPFSQVQAHYTTNRIQFNLTIPPKPANEDLVLVFFKELACFKWITLRFFDRYLHAGLITHTNNFGWFVK